MTRGDGHPAKLRKGKVYVQFAVAWFFEGLFLVRVRVVLAFESRGRSSAAVTRSAARGNAPDHDKSVPGTSPLASAGCAGVRIGPPVAPAAGEIPEGAQGGRGSWRTGECAASARAE